MPIIREYDQRLNAPSKQISPAADPGVAMREGAGMQAVGNLLTQTSKQIFDIAEQNEIATLQVETATARANLNEKLRRAKETGEAADPDYVKFAAEAAQDEAAKLADNKNTRRGAEAARVQGAALSLDAQTLAIRDNSFAVAEHSKNAAKAALDKNGNTLLGNPEFFGPILKETLDYWDGPGGLNIDAPLRERIKQESKQHLATFAVNGIILANPALAKDQLTKGLWDDYIPPEQKLALLNRADSKLAEDQGRANLEAMFVLHDKAENGILGRTEILNAYDAKILKSPSQAISLDNRSKERAKEIERQRQLDVAINIGDPRPLIAYTGKEKQEGFDRFAGKMMLAGEANASTRINASNQIVTRGMELNLISSQIKAQLETATISRPEQFAVAANWYDGLKTVNPHYANAHVAPEQAALFDVYLTAKPLGEAQAIEVTRLAGDPEKMREFRKNLSKEDLRKIEIEVNNSSYLPIGYDSDRGFHLTRNATNSSWAKNAIADLTKLRMTFGDSNVADSTKWALKQFNDRHVLVGDRWLPRVGSTHPDTGKALDEYLTRLPEALKKNGLSQDAIDPNGYELRADRQTSIDGSLLVYEKSTNMPKPGYRVTPKEAVQAYKKLTEEKAAGETQKEAERFKSMRDAVDTGEPWNPN